MKNYANMLKFFINFSLSMYSKIFPAYIFISLSIISTSFSKSILILDAASEQPINGCHIIAKDGKVASVSDMNGFANYSCENQYFDVFHISYHHVRFKPDCTSQKIDTVFLEEKTSHIQEVAVEPQSATKIIEQFLRIHLSHYHKNSFSLDVEFSSNNYFGSGTIDIQNQSKTSWFCNGLLDPTPRIKLNDFTHSSKLSPFTSRKLTKQSWLDFSQLTTISQLITIKDFINPTKLIQERIAIHKNQAEYLGDTTIDGHQAMYIQLLDTVQKHVGRKWIKKRIDLFLEKESLALILYRDLDHKYQPSKKSFVIQDYGLTLAYRKALGHWFPSYYKVRNKINKDQVLINISKIDMNPELSKDHKLIHDITIKDFQEKMRMYLDTNNTSIENKLDIDLLSKLDSSSKQLKAFLLRNIEIFKSLNSIVYRLYYIDGNDSPINYHVQLKKRHSNSQLISFRSKNIHSNEEIHYNPSSLQVIEKRKIWEYQTKDFGYYKLWDKNQSVFEPIVYPKFFISEVLSLLPKLYIFSFTDTVINTKSFLQFSAKNKSISSPIQLNLYFSKQDSLIRGYHFQSGGLVKIKFIHQVNFQADTVKWNTGKQYKRYKYRLVKPKGLLRDRLGHNYLFEEVDRKPEQIRRSPSEIDLRCMLDIRDQVLCPEQDFILLYYWFEHCHFCQKSIPLLHELHQKKNLEVIGINLVDPDIERIENFISKNKILFPNTMDGKHVMLDKKIISYPTYVLTHKSGKILYLQDYYDPKKLKKTINKITR